ncbi:alpha/beta fold hydrolase [Patiriisocius marinus]|uniref:alpha/beta fold hydrolase n=1 Tax=Patiriisocius marinus TaxID=1397112 RepID=UPI002331258B|nr:alpha/beta hydrolase [Patiriisocius marinus]
MIYQYNNTPIYYTREGEGSAIVFLHGFLESSMMWKNITPHFTNTHTVITIDLPGFGKSDSLGETHTMELLAQLTAEILTVEAIESATFIGHSMGGYVILALAQTMPQLINTIVLLNSNPLEDSLQRKVNRNRALAIIDKNKDAFVSMAISNLFTENERTLFTSEISQLKEEALQLQPEAIKATITGMRDRQNRVSVLKKFEGNKIIISGILDPMVPINEIIKISEETNSTLYKVDSGHMSWLTNCDEIIKLLHFIE